MAPCSGPVCTTYFGRRGNEAITEGTRHRHQRKFLPFQVLPTPINLAEAAWLVQEAAGRSIGALRETKAGKQGTL